MFNLSTSLSTLSKVCKPALLDGPQCEKTCDSISQNNVDAILESFKYTTAFPESRGLGHISMIVRIGFLFILLFKFLNSSFSSLSFVQLSVASLLIVAMCMVLIVRYFINVSSKTLFDSLTK